MYGLTCQHCHIQIGVQVCVQAAARVVIDQLPLGLPAPLVRHSERAVVHRLLLCTGKSTGGRGRPGWPHGHGLR